MELNVLNYHWNRDSEVSGYKKRVSVGEIFSLAGMPFTFSSAAVVNVFIFSLENLALV